MNDEIELVERANAMHMLFGLWLQSLNRNEPDFAPPFPNNLVFAFTDFPQEEKLRAEFPEAYTYTRRDLDAARSLLPSSTQSAPAPPASRVH